MNSSSISYTDLNAMSQLKAGSDANSPENMRRVAEQFESLFMNMMIKSMRDANASFGEDNPLNTPQTKMYQDMYDSQMAVHLSEKQGVGLADVLMRQLSPNKTAPAAPAGAAKDVAETGGVDQSALLARRRLAIASSYGSHVTTAPQEASAATATASPSAERPVAVARQEASAEWQPMRALKGVVRNAPSTMQALGDKVAAAPTAATGRGGQVRFNSPAEFTAAMLPMAEKAAERLGVDPHYLVAQAALETGWGKSIIKGGDGASSHNLFGIKAHGGWKGESSSVMTSEYRDGVKGAERASFRSYASFEQSFDDYVSFLENNGRYATALGKTENPDEFFRELQRAGYATDPQYARKVSQIAQKLLGETRLAAAPQDNAATEGRA